MKKNILFIVMLLLVSGVANARDAFQTVLPEPQPVQEFEGPNGYGGDDIVEIIDQEQLPDLDLEIQGVFWGIEKPSVLIGGKQYTLKDIIDGTDARILKIEKSKVTVLYGGSMVEISPRSNLQ